MRYNLSKYFVRMVLVPVFSVTLFGCGGPTADGTSSEAFDFSLQKMSVGLSEEERQLLGTSIGIIASNIAMKSEQDLSNPTAATNQDFLKIVDGKNFSQIVSIAEKLIPENKVLMDERSEQLDAKVLEIKEQREARSRELQKEQLLLQMAGLEALAKKAPKAEEMLSKVVVLRSELSRRNMGNYFETDIEVELKNSTGVPFGKVHFQGMLVSPYGGEPWHQEPVYMEIPGGLEPDATTTVKVKLGNDEYWNRVVIPPDSKFKLTVEQIESANGSELYSIKNFNQEKKMELEKYRAQLRELENQS